MLKISNLNRVMDAGDHFKNGASLKSQMSRGNFLRKACFLVALVFALCSVFVACVDDNSEELENLRQQLAAEKKKKATGVAFEGDNMIITFSNGTTTTMAIPEGLQGPKGDPGNGIESITYDPDTGILTITMTNGLVSEFLIPANGGSNEKIQLPEYIIFGGKNYLKFEYDDQNRITKVMDYGEYIIAILTYDGDNLVKIVNSDDDEPSVTTVFVKNGNKITATETRIVGREDWVCDEFGCRWEYYMDTATRTYTIDLNNEGYPIKAESSGARWDEVWSSEAHLQVQEGNLLNFTRIYERTTNEGGTVYEYSGEFEYNYKYDDNKSPFYHCKTPKWYLSLCWDQFYGVHDYLQLFGTDLLLGSKNNAIEMTEESHGSGEIFKKEFRYRFDSAGYPITRTMIESWNVSVVEFFYFQAP